MTLVKIFQITGAVLPDITVRIFQNYKHIFNIELKTAVYVRIVG